MSDYYHKELDNEMLRLPATRGLIHIHVLIETEMVA